jgi:PAS domain S-box-containing protein
MVVPECSRKDSNLLFCSILCFGIVLSGANSAYCQQLPIKSYTIADGLAHDRVMRIVRDSRGFLWFCTVDGLSRFDGTEFATYGRDQGLACPFVYDLLETRQGEYWVATYGGGVARLNLNIPAGEGRTRSRFTAYEVSGDPAANRVRVLRRDRAGQLWVGTEGGLFLLEERNSEVRFRLMELGLASHPDDLVPVWALLEDREGSLWIDTSVGLIRRLPDGRISHILGYSFADNPAVRSLLEDGDGKIWLGQKAALIVLRPDAASARVARQFTPAEGLIGERVRAMFRSTDGRIWIGTSACLNELDGERFRSYGEVQGVQGGSINALAEDSDGNLWVGTDHGGALRIAQKGFVSFKGADFPSHPWITSILEGRSGELYVLSGGELAISRFDSRQFSAVKPNVPKWVSTSAGGFHPALQDHAGEWWVPTIGGLYRFARVPQLEHLARARPKAVYRVQDGLASDDVSVLFEDSHGDLWITSSAPAREALTRWERATGTFHRYSDQDRLPAFNPPSAFGEDTAGHLWIGFRGGGLARFQDYHFTVFGRADGAPGGAIGEIYLDQSGRLWVASAEGGLIRVEDPGAQRPRFVSYTTGQGLSSNRVYCLTGDRSGRLYLGTVRGVDRFDPETGRVKRYGTADGLAASEVLVAFRERSGTLWFGTYEGLSRLTPEMDRNSSPPPALIAGLRVGGMPQPVSELGEPEVSWRELGPHQNQVQISFFGVSFGSGEGLRYQHKLEGADRDWSDPTLQRSINYANLAPGRYRFLVRAVDADGAVSPTPASMSFRILPTIWLRPWFITLVGVLIAAAVVTFDRYRAARLKELKAALTQSLELTKELTEQRAELARAHHVLELEYAITGILAEASTPVEAARRMLRVICERAGWQIGAIWDLHPETQVLHCADVWRAPGMSAVTFEALTRQQVFVSGEGLPGRVLETGQAHWVTDLTQDSNFPRAIPAAKEGLSSAFGFPMLLRGGVIGVLEFFSRERREPDPEQILMMSAVGSEIGQLMERKRGEEALRETEKRFRTLAETASDAIITVDAAGAIVFVNPAAEKVFGYTLTDLVGEELTILIPEYLRHLHRAGFARYQQTGQRHMAWTAVELPGLHCDGHEIPLEISFGEFISDGRRYFTGIARDVTERKRAEEALRRSREERLAELERVRKRIATDLHDDIGSSLTRISLLSEVVRRQIGSIEATLAEPLSSIARLSRELVDSMSDIVWAINPNKDHLSDLSQRMRHFASDLFTARQIEFRFPATAAELDIKVGANVRREVFLVFKEAVNNIVRHSGCTEAAIELSGEPQGLVLKLSDNGRGFDTSGGHEGHGLSSMRERTEGLGGRLELSSQAAQGTTLKVTVPLSPLHQSTSAAAAGKAE